MEELTTDQLEALRQNLCSLGEDLARLLAVTKDASAPVDLDEPMGRLSRMDAMQQQKMLAANRTAARLRQQQVAAALERMERDEYGECQSCGEAIGYPRLEANPEAPFCLGCQSAREAER